MNQLEEAQFWREIDEALGLRPSDKSLALGEAFKAAGFSEADAQRGVEMMSSGRYFGFVDTATSLAMQGDRALGPIQKTRIEEAARHLESAGPTEADFRDVGLSKAHAREAAEGLSSGRYVSFEDACLSTAANKVGVRTLRESAMREKARAFARVTGR